MKIHHLAVLSAVLLSSFAHAEGLSRAQVRQQLIEAEQNGSLNYTDASYPEVIRQAIASGAAATSAYGSAMSAKTEGGHRAIASTAGMPSACVGPASFCNIYAGS
ncbi:DUF4148 domain-containing protein [Burkholderia gladioli]|uniref:DUF4148 domain-containing protein n=1 Tax=Burkholderia gladioli TaxID=28095 RepID=UPI0022DC8634|nr:DUF4148 domain-containing protein [Burkholderia gladioli]MDA0575597.1 DUF4148 domain-containing protein [Burkholderia gladioli]MDA0603832.1 DUF4148 domain-containing protein [Burkholderia gladioli]